MIDLVKGELSVVRSQVAPADQRKLDAHLDNIRALETRLSSRSALCQGPVLGSESDGPTVAEHHFELMTAALACDLTRVASFQWSFADNGGGTYPWHDIGGDGHHTITHQDPRQFPDTIAKQIAIKHFYATMFASLLSKLDAVPEGSGTLLDNSIVVWGSKLGDAYVHNPEPTPFIVAGGGAGALRMGQHLDCKGVYHNRLLVSICQAMDAQDVMTFGHTDGGSGGLLGLT